MSGFECMEYYVLFVLTKDLLNANPSRHFAGTSITGIRRIRVQKIFGY